MTQKIFDDTITALKVTMSAARPTTIYVADTLDLAGGEVSANFDIRMEDELLRVTAVVLDDPTAGTDKWTVAHLGGAAASGHDAGVEIELVLTASGIQQFIADDIAGTYAALAGATFTGDVEFEADIIDDTESAGSNGQVLTKVSGHPRWATPVDDDSAYVTKATLTTKGDLLVRDSTAPIRVGVGSNDQVLTADSTAASGVKWATPAGGGDVSSTGATFTGDVEFEADIIDDTESAGSNGDVLTKVSGHPRWAAQAGGGDVSSTGATFTGDVEFEADIIDDTEAAGTNGQVLTKVSGHPRWAAPSGGAPSSWAALVKLSGPTGYWQMLEGSGTSFADSSGFTNAGTGHGTTASGSGGPFSGKVNFDGTNDYMDFAARPIGAGLLPVTLEWWIKPAAGTFVGLIDTAPSAGGTLRNYNTGFFEKQGASNIAISSMSNAWHHLALIIFPYNGGIIHAVVMIDGAVDHTADLNASSLAWATGWTLGNINGGGAGWWSGDMAHFAVYPKALSPAEIKYHYDNGTTD